MLISVETSHTFFFASKRFLIRPTAAVRVCVALNPWLQGKFSDRQTFLIDGKGTVVGHWLERDGSMANVKTPAHTEQILAAIDKL